MFTPPPTPPTHCNNRAKEYSDAQLAAVNAAIEAHTTLLLDIKIDAPIVILPENPNAIHSKGIVADLGKFELHTSPQVEVLEDKGEEKVTENAETKGETSTIAVVVDVSAQEDQTTNANDFQRRNVGDLNNVELEKKYDHFYFVGQAIAIRVGTLDLTERQQDNENTKQHRRASFVSDNAIQNALQPAKTGGGGGGVDSSSSSASTTKLSEEEMKNMFQQVKKGQEQELQHSISTYRHCSNEMFNTMDLRSFLMSFYTLHDPAQITHVQQHTSSFTEHPIQHFVQLITTYRIKLPSPEQLALTFRASGNLASRDVVTFAKEHRLLHLGGSLNVQAHTCSLPAEISTFMGFPKAIVKAFFPPVVVDLSPPALIDMVTVAKSIAATTEGTPNAPSSNESKDPTTSNKSATAIAAAAVQSPEEEQEQEETKDTKDIKDTKENKDKKMSVDLIVDVVVSELAVNLVSPEGEPVLAVAVRQTKSHLFMKGNGKELYSTSSIQSIVIENRRDELNKMSLKMLRSPLENACLLVQNVWRRRMKQKHPEKYRNDALSTRPLLEGSSENNAPFVTISVTMKKGGESEGEGEGEEGGGGTLDINTKVSLLHIGLNNRDVLLLWEELGQPIMKGLQDLKMMNQVLDAAAAPAAVDTVADDATAVANNGGGAGDAVDAIDAGNAGDASGAAAMRITFVAKWETIDIALKCNDDVIAYARLRQFSSSGVLQGSNNVDVRISTKSLVVDDIDLHRPPLLLFAPTSPLQQQQQQQQQKQALVVRYLQLGNKSDVEVMAGKLKLAVHPGFAMDLMRRFLKPVVSSMLVVTRSMAELGLMGKGGQASGGVSGGVSGGGCWGSFQRQRTIAERCKHSEQWCSGQQRCCSQYKCQ